ncbi:MAG: hypothetical protein V3R34_04670, partial [Hyphomicrobium sp.]
MITAPTDGSSYAANASITFAGTASDAEDGDLTGSLSLSSNLDGAIGNGGSFSATLSAGIHTVTAAISDSGGLNAQDAISVIVGSPPNQ